MVRTPHYLVELSPWPIIFALRIIYIILGIVDWFHYNNLYLLLMGAVLIILCLFQWWRDVVYEATILGKHTLAVQRSLRIGIILFIVREVCFFFSFFWAFFHSSFVPIS